MYAMIYMAGSFSYLLHELESHLVITLDLNHALRIVGSNILKRFGAYFSVIQFQHKGKTVTSFSC